MLRVIKERNLEVARMFQERIRELDAPCAVGVTPDYDVRIYGPARMIQLDKKSLEYAAKTQPSGLVLGY
jgi:hypothetical protein